VADVIATLTMHALVSIIAFFGPMIYKTPYVMLLMRTNLIRGQVGGGLGLKIETFLGPKWHLPNGSLPVHRA
jgi:hypothetical protein